MQKSYLIAILSLLIISPTIMGQQSSLPPWAGVELVGAPTKNFIDSERFKFGDTINMNNKSFYPIPNLTITRDTYMQILESLDLEAFAANPNRGLGGFDVFLPILAKYVQTGDDKWGLAIIEMLKNAHKDMQRIVEEKGMIWHFEGPVTSAPLYRKHLMVDRLQGLLFDQLA